MKAERIKPIGPIERGERGEHVDKYAKEARAAQRAAAVSGSPRVTSDRYGITEVSRVMRGRTERTTYVEVPRRNGHNTVHAT